MVIVREIQNKNKHYIKFQKNHKKVKKRNIKINHYRVNNHQ